MTEWKKIGDIPKDFEGRVWAYGSGKVNLVWTFIGKLWNVRYYHMQISNTGLYEDPFDVTHYMEFVAPEPPAKEE